MDQTSNGLFDPERLMLAIATRRDRVAFERLFEFYAPRLKTFLIRRGAAPGTAEDLAQEAMLALWYKSSSFDPTKAAVSTWLFTIARNLRIDEVRRAVRSEEKAHIDLDWGEEPALPDAQLVSSEDDSRVRSALAELPADQRRVLELSVFDELAHGDIARTLDIPLGTVKSRIRLAMQKLRQLLGDDK